MNRKDFYKATHLADSYNDTKKDERKFLNEVSTLEHEEDQLQEIDNKIEEFNKELDKVIEAFAKLFDISTYEAYTYLDCRFCHGRKEFLEVIEKYIEEK